MTIEEAAQKYTIRGVPSSAIEYFWKYAEPYVKRALEHTSGEFAPADLKMLCKDRDIQLWLVSEGERVIAAATTEIVNYPQRRHLRVITLAGSKAPEWTGVLDIILQNWGKEQGCVAVEAMVRKGYVPVLAKYDYKHKYSSVIKDIS